MWIICLGGEQISQLLKASIILWLKWIIDLQSGFQNDTWLMLMNDQLWILEQMEHQKNLSLSRLCSQLFINLPFFFGL
jgi:hypothetical protein